jgi:hypothetical protein
MADHAMLSEQTFIANVLRITSADYVQVIHAQDIGNKSLFRKHCMIRHFDMDWEYIDLHLKNRKVSN